MTPAIKEISSGGCRFGSGRPVGTSVAFPLGQRGFRGSFFYYLIVVTFNPNFEELEVKRMGRCDDCPFEADDELCADCACQSVCVGCRHWDFEHQLCVVEECPYQEDNRE